MTKPHTSTLLAALQSAHLLTAAMERADSVDDISMLLAVATHQAHSLDIVCRVAGILMVRREMSGEQRSAAAREDRAAAVKIARDQIQIDALRQMAADRYEQDGGTMAECWSDDDYANAIGLNKTAVRAWAYHVRTVEAGRESAACYDSY